MSSRYSPGADGPWECDDDSVFGAGYYHSGIFNSGHPTVDGLEPRSAPKHHGRGGLVRGHDEHLVHQRNTHRGHR